MRWLSARTSRLTPRCSPTPPGLFGTRPVTGRFVDKTCVRVAGRWRYLDRAVDQYGQVIDVLLSEQRHTAAARRFLTRTLAYVPTPVEVTTGKAAPSLRVLDELARAAATVTEQYGSNRIEADDGRSKVRLRPMGALTRFGRPP